MKGSFKTLQQGFTNEFEKVLKWRGLNDWNGVSQQASSNGVQGLLQDGFDRVIAKESEQFE